MAFLKNEKLDNVNEKLKELQQKRQTLSDEISNIQQTLDETFNYFAQGKVTDEQIEQANELLREKQEEYKQNEQYIAKVEDVRKKTRFESIPFLREQQRKKSEEIQKRYDEKLSVIEQKRNEYIRELAQLGEIVQESSSVTNEFNETVKTLGGKHLADGTLDEKKLFSGGFTPEAETLGLKEQTQKDVLRSAKTPSFAKEDE